MPEHQFADAVLAALGAPGTVGVGYNTIRFDDEVTRHLFWRNLIDPYGREWQKRLRPLGPCWTWCAAPTPCGPTACSGPRHDDGRVSFKLEHLTVANGLVHEAAHDALSDVRATIALARLVRNPPAAAVRLLPEAAPQGGGVAGDRPAPAVPAHQRHVPPPSAAAWASCGRWPSTPPTRTNSSCGTWAHDPSELLALDADTLRLRLFSKVADLPEGMARLPVKTIHANKSPVVIGNLKTPA